MCELRVCELRVCELRMCELRVCEGMCICYSLAMVFHCSGVGGSGKTFTADRLLMKLFTITKKSDWFQDLRKAS